MSDHVGKQFGEYRLTRELGSGGFGDVYLSEHVSDGTPAAVKVMQIRLTHSEDLASFINEVRVLFRLQHSNIVPLLDFGVEHDEPFLVMAYAPNGTLRQPKGRRLPLDIIVNYIQQIAEALQCAHDRKLIHRDVKPDNILLGPDFQVWLSDFGIVSIAHSSDSLNTLDRAGTISYMAPEQILGKPRPASDQYALGVVTYEWICGCRPFNGTDTEIAIQHSQARPPSLCEQVPSLSPITEQVVLKALEKEPRKRFESVLEFARALAAAVERPEPVLRKTENSPSIITFPHPSRAKQPKPAPLKTREQWLDRGDGLYLDGRCGEAILAYNNAIELDPLYAVAYNNRGNAYMALQQYERAIEDHNRGIELNPQVAIAYYNRGSAYDGLKQYRQAIRDYTRAIELDFRDAKVYTDRGSDYLELRQYDRAIRDYNRAIEIDPLYITAYTSRGFTYFEIKQYEQALKDYTRAIELDPRDPTSFGNRGLIYYYLKDYRWAIEDFDYALHLDPGIAWFKSERKAAYRKLGWRM